MNEPRCDEFDYIQFLVAAQKVFNCTEAARSQPHEERSASHDSFTRLLTRQPPDTEALWAEAAGLVRLGGGLLLHDDSTIDKPYAKRMGLVTRHWSGKHHRMVSGCFRTHEGAAHFCRIRGYISTAREQGQNALDATQRVFRRDPFTHAFHPE